jgi:hypothetical protein
VAGVVARRLVVVLGEAGLGKASEFEEQAAKALRDRKTAVFLPLSRVTSAEALSVRVDDNADQIKRWSTTDEHGYFFLDSVDEARLKSTDALSFALRLVAKHILQPHIARASVFLSTRISDWDIPAVCFAIEDLLLRPMQAATSAKRSTVGDTDETLNEVGCAGAERQSVALPPRIAARRANQRGADARLRRSLRR